jgi:hypothetical protein
MSSSRTNELFWRTSCLIFYTLHLNRVSSFFAFWKSRVRIFSRFSMLTEEFRDFFLTGSLTKVTFAPLFYMGVNLVTTSEGGTKTVSVKTLAYAVDNIRA